MTEIPEHLLKRSKARRAAIDDDAEGGEGGTESGSDTTAEAPASAAPATTSAAPAAVPEPVEPEPEPVRPEVAAYQGRRRVPYWALPVIAFLPLWAYLFQGTLSPVPEDDVGPLGHGGAIYASQCASCHGARGGGEGAGPALGTVVEHWPDHRDQALWVRLGSTGWPGDTRGATDTPVGVGMPGFGGLSDAELAEVVLYTRVTHGGLDIDSDEALELIEIAEGELTFAEAGPGELSEDAGVTEDQLEGGG